MIKNEHLILMSQEEVIAKQKEWSDFDRSKDKDFSTHKFWIIDNEGNTEGFNEAGEILSWCKQNEFDYDKWFDYLNEINNKKYEMNVIVKYFDDYKYTLTFDEKKCTWGFEINGSERSWGGGYGYHDLNNAINAAKRFILDELPDTD